MEQAPHNTNTVAGTIGGTLLVLCMKINVDDILNNALLAGIGAVVSFGVSLIMKAIIKKFSRKK